MPYRDAADQAAAAKRHYERNREAMIVRAAAARKATRERYRAHIREVKESTPCADCGVRYPAYVMQFDHVDGKKVENISNLVNRSVSFDRLLSEIGKCAVVCANCHAERTHRRRIG